MIEQLEKTQNLLNTLLNVSLDNYRISYKLGEVISVCPGKAHAWYQSKIGPIKKPIASMENKSKWSSVFKYTIWEKIVLFIKKIFKK